jgi:uncharacterized protein (TIGR03083 family)
VDQNEQVRASIAAWAETLDAVIGLGETLTPQQWRLGTECPEWTVKDVYSHLVGGELWMADGHPAPAEGLGTIAGRPVLERQDADPLTVLAELRDVFTLRQQQIEENPPDPDQPTYTAYGAPVTLAILLSHRAFDAWVHEQDIRRAVGEPGNLGVAGGHIAAAILTSALPRVVAKLAAAPAGSTVRLSVDGEIGFDDLITVDDSGRGKLQRGAGATEAVPTVQLAMDWETYSRLAAGRIAASAAAVRVSGDTDLAGRILEHFAVTP